MTHTGVEMLMANLKQLIHGSHNPLTSIPSVLSKRPQFQLLYQEFASIIQTLFIHQHHHLLEPQKVRGLKRRLKNAAEEAEDIIDLFLSVVHLRNKGLVTPADDVFETSLNLGKVIRSLESIKVDLMTISIHNMKMDLSPTINLHETQSAGMKRPLEEIVVGLDRDVELIRDKLAEDQKQLAVISIVGMGGLGKTTLATKVFNDRFVMYHFHLRAWVTVSQTYERQELLIQILTSIGVQVDLENDSVSILRQKLHKQLISKRYLIVIDDIWSVEAWDDLKLCFPRENTGSRILLTSRLNEVALHANPHGFVHFLLYLTEEQSWELLRKKVFQDAECPKSLIEPGMQIAKRCQGLPLSLVLMAGILAKQRMSKDVWEKIACSVNSYIMSEHKGYLETLALSYHHLPHHLRDCFLYLGGFPASRKIYVETLIWLWGAEGFIADAGNRSLEETANVYLMDLINRNLLIVAERGFDGDVKACKVHDLVRELCLEKAKEESFSLIIDRPLSLQLYGVIITLNEDTTPYKQHRLFVNQDIYIQNCPHIRSLLCFYRHISFDYQNAEFFHSFALLRVLDLRRCELIDCTPWIGLLVHLRYLAIWVSVDFPSAVCNLWNLQTLVVTTSVASLELPSNISDLVNLRHLWSCSVFYLPSIDKPMNLQSISDVELGYGVENFQKCFPCIKKLASTRHPCRNEVIDFEILPYLETLKLTKLLSNHKNIHIRYSASLKKLTLKTCHLPWSDMSSIQSLPKLEVLILDNAFVGRVWNTGEEQFRRLKFLRLKWLDIEQWDVCSMNFPYLKRLQVMNCRNLEEIPSEIGDISTLELLEVNSQSFSVVKSIKKIQLEQHAMGNYELKLIINGEDVASFSQECAPVFFRNSWWFSQKHNKHVNSRRI